MASMSPSWDGPTRTDQFGNSFPDVGQGSLWEAAEPVALDPGRKAEFQVHCTPRAVVEQCLRAVLSGWTHACPTKSECHEPLLRVLDLCAGYGVWSMVLRQLAALMGFAVHITAVEIRQECRPSLLRHCDTVHIVDAATWAQTRDRYDFVVGNPPFSFPDKRANREQVRPGVWTIGKSRLRAFELLVAGCRQLLAGQDSRLALFVPGDWLGRSRPLAKLAQEHKPIMVLDQALPVAFGADHKTDTRVYCMMVWGHVSTPARPCELTTLPLLDPEQLRWDGDTIPGTEDASLLVNIMNTEESEDA